MKNIRNIILSLPAYYRDIHEGVAIYAKEQGWHLHDALSQGSIYSIGTWKGDGVIAQAFWCDKDYDREIRRVKKRGIPISVIGDHIRPDDDKIGIMAADHLLEKGFWNIAWFAPSVTKGNPRIKAFEKRLLESRGYQALRFSPPPAMLDWDKRLRDLKNWMQDAPKPLAVFCIQDALATQVVDAAFSAGLRIPDDIAVLGVDNEELICETSVVPISSIDTNLRQVGYSAAGILDKAMQGEPLPHECRRIPPKGIIARRSTDVIAVEHHEVAKAVIFIRDHFRENINIPDVVQQTGLSQRGLYKAFRKYLNCSIGSMITAERMEYARKLLLETDMKISSIAYASGFRDTQTFYPAFKRRFGSSPRQWRQQHRRESNNEDILSL